MWRSEADLLLELESGVDALNLGIMIVHILLNLLEGGVSKLLSHQRVNLLNRLDIVHVNVLIAICLENITWHFAALKTCRVNEVTIFAPGAAVGAVVVAAGYGAEVARLDELVLLEDCLLGGHLIELSHLDSSLLIHFLELPNLLVSKRD